MGLLHLVPKWVWVTDCPELLGGSFAPFLHPLSKVPGASYGSLSPDAPVGCRVPLHGEECPLGLRGEKGAGSWDA